MQTSTISSQPVVNLPYLLGVTPSASSIDDSIPVLMPPEYRSFKKDYVDCGEVGQYLLSRFPISREEVIAYNNYDIYFKELTAQEYDVVTRLIDGIRTYRGICLDIAPGGIAEQQLRHLLETLSRQRTIYWLQPGMAHYREAVDQSLREQYRSSPLSSEILYSYIKYKHGINYQYAPSKAALILTSSCNADCVTCYRGAVNRLYQQDRLYRELTSSEIQSLLEDFATIGLDRVKLLGGEPFTRSDIFHIIDMVQARNMSCEISTNGIALADRDIVAELERKKRSLLHIQVSLDGVCESQDIQRRGADHRTVLQALRHLSQSSISYSINTIVTRYNLNEIEEIIKLSTQFNARVRFQSVKLIGAALNAPNILPTPREFKDTSDRIDAWIKQYSAPCENAITLLPVVNRTTPFRKEWASPIHHCRAFCYSVAVSPNGIILPCEFFEPFPEFWGRTITETPVLDEWHRSPIAKRLRTLKTFGKCARCGYGHACEKGCLVETLTITGSLESSNPLCWFKEGDSPQAEIPATNDFIYRSSGTR